MEIKVMISGLILLVSSNAYMSSGGTDAITAGVVVNGRTPFNSEYDVDIPVHDAVLDVNKNEVVSVTDPDDRFPVVVNKRVLKLNGDRIQFGKGQPCRALESSVVTRDSTATLPRLSEMLTTSPKLKPEAAPQAAEFGGINSGLVLGWLELNGGSLRPKRDKDQHENIIHDEVEFRPSRRRADLAPTVEWTLDAGSADCMIITPFEHDGHAITVMFDPNQSPVISLRNMAVPDTGEVVTGVGYDYEIFYSLLQQKPSIPPIPYALNATPPPDGHVHGSTGVNCGPPKL